MVLFIRPIRFSYLYLYLATCVFWGMCDVFLLLFMALWVPISVTLCWRAVLTLWHAFLFLGLRFPPSFLLFAWWPPLPFLVRN
jgi:hypothetical protein